MTRHTMQCNAKATRRQRTFRPHTEGLEDRKLMTAGDLDTTFGGTGYVFTSMPARTYGTTNSIAATVKVQANGTILVGGQTNSSDFGLARYTPQGKLDTTFGSGGRVLTDFNGKQDGGREIAILANGNILMAGGADMGSGTASNRDFALARYLPNGTLDTAFGPNHNGKVTTNLSTAVSTSMTNKYDFANGMAVQSDGKIVLAGLSDGGITNNDGSLVRYNSDGSLDTTFGPNHDGKVILAMGPGNDSFAKVRIQPLDGKIVAAGYGIDPGGREDFFVSRFNTDGTLDTTFGPAQSGIVLTPVGATGGAEASALELQADGKIVVAGIHFDTVSASNNGVALARYTPTGALDTSFGGSGVLILGGVSGSAKALAIQPDGKLVVVGYALSPGGTPAGSSLVARLLPDGIPDATFAGGGIEAIDASPNEDWLSAVTLQTDGKIVAVGRGYAPGASPTTSPESFLVMRLKADSSPLLASAVAPAPVHQSLTAAQSRPALAQALAYWRSHGEDTSRLGHIDLAIANLGGERLGEASGSAITLDDDAAGWGWSVGRVLGSRGGRMDLLSALTHEVGHLLGHDHAEGGVMAETLAPGVRQALPIAPPLAHTATAARLGARSAHPHVGHPRMTTRK